MVYSFSVFIADKSPLSYNGEDTFPNVTLRNGGSIGAMSTSPSSMPQDQRNAYFTDPENAAEMVRLTRQARLLTKAMGGPLSEQNDLSHIRDILDLACGPGEWVLETATRYPDKRVTGVDISRLMIDYARLQALQNQVGNARFKVMNILEDLEFPDASFDLVNARLVGPFVFRSPDAWPQLLKECLRILRPGGIIRLTDCEWPVSSNPITEKYSGLCIKAAHLAGNRFLPDGRQLCTTPMLGRFLRNIGCQRVQTRAYAVDCSAGADAHQGYCEDARVFFKLLQPLIIKTGLATQEELDNLYQQTIEEMRSDDFNCIWYYLTAWSERP